MMELDNVPNPYNTKVYMAEELCGDNIYKDLMTSLTKAGLIVTTKTLGQQ
jgi:hypothetical protein